jgi:ubiquinone/menaquinone biosynthesis C-methylase UbiE
MIAGNRFCSAKIIGPSKRQTVGMNFFAYPTAAKRYAKGRPFFHPLAIRKIQAVCCENGRIDRALDVDCGTGQSTLALLEVAKEIVGLDSSAEMLSRAIQHERIRYIEGQAEQMPFVDAEFGLMTVGLAFHWFDQRKFLLEAQRLLRPEGWLIIYNDVFTGHMNGNDDFKKWFREEYLARHPSPPRHNQPLTEIGTSEYGLAAYNFEQFIHETEFSTEQLVSYLVTQTNVISAVETGIEDLRSVINWLSNSVRPLISEEKKCFLFSCQIRFLKRD